MGFANNPLIGQLLTFSGSVFFYTWSINWTTCPSCGRERQCVSRLHASPVHPPARSALWWYSPPLRAMEETLVVTIDQAASSMSPPGPGAHCRQRRNRRSDLAQARRHDDHHRQGLWRNQFHRARFRRKSPGAIAYLRCRRPECLARAARVGSPILRLRAAMSANREARGRCQIFRRGRRAGKGPHAQTTGLQKGCLERRSSLRFF